MELNNTIAASNNNVFDFSAIDAAIEAQAEELANVAKKREEAAEARKEILAKDTLVSVAFTQRGKIAVVSGSFTDGFTKPLIGDSKTSKGIALTAEESAMMAVSTAVKQAAASPKKHIAIYTNGNSVLRLSGMVNRINKKDDTILTKGEVEFVQKNLRRYGNSYGTVCKVVFNSLKDAIAAGKVVAFHGLDELGFAPLQYRVPAEADGETVELKRGYGRINLNGRSYTVKVRNGFLTGNYKLVADSFGRISVEDPIDAEKAPGKALAFKLFQLASRTVTIKSAAEQADAAMEEATAVAA